MPGLDDRNKREAELAAAIVLLFQDYKMFWPDINWPAFEADLAAAIGPALGDAYGTAAGQLRDRLKLDATRIDATQGAAAWAEAYSRELARAVVANSQEAASAGKDGELQFSDSRAERIAVTEMTRSITAGEFGTIAAATSLGLLTDTEVIWQTAEDEMVCKVCRPLHDQPQEVWAFDFPAGPPAHPHCRCELYYQ